MKRLSLALILLCACSSPKEERQNHSRPEVPPPVSEEDMIHDSLPLPLPRHHPSAVAYFSDVLEHPWVQRQERVSLVHAGMIDDIRSLPPSLASPKLIATLDKLQQRLDPFDFYFPPELYSMLNIPEVDRSLYPAPVPFQIYKRLYLGENRHGFPILADVRLFPLSQGHDLNAIIKWHVNLLHSSSFDTFTGQNRLVLLGRGDRDPALSHGLFSRDRGVFTAFARTPTHLAALHADAPYEDLAPHMETLLAMVNRPLARLPSDAPLTLP